MSCSARAVAVTVLVPFAIALSACRGAEAEVQFSTTPHLLVDEDLYRYRGEWGTMRLPAPGGGLAWEAAFLRLHARTDTPGDPIFFVAGGPAISAIESLAGTVPDLDALLQLGDVVAVDQRGAGFTRPQLDCAERRDLPLDAPLPRQAYIDESRRRFESCRRAWEAEGADLSVIHTQTYADDIVRVADHLGYDRIRLFAHSYGTQIALDFLRRHGARAERVVLAGVMDTGDSLRLSSSADRVFADLAQRIAADAALAAAYPDPEGLARRAVQRLRDEPLTVPHPDGEGTVVIDDYLLRWTATQMLGRRQEIGHLPVLLHALARGETSPRIAEWIDDMVHTALRDRQGPLSRRSSAAHYLTVCASGISPERLVRLRAEDATSLFGFVLHVSLPEACGAWGVAPLGEDYRAPIESDVPVLMISGSLDVRTPAGQAEALMPGLRNGAHLLIRPAGHGDLLAQAPVNEKIMEFLQGAEIASQEFDLDWPEILLP